VGFSYEYEGRLARKNKLAQACLFLGSKMKCTKALGKRGRNGGGGRKGGGVSVVVGMALVGRRS